MSCRFCHIIQENTKQVFRDEFISVFLDIDPIANGHVLIMPNEHYLDIDDLPEETLNRIMAMARQMVSLYKTELAPPGYSIMQNGGHFNYIGHFHLHVFPRYDEEHFSFSYGNAATALPYDREEMQQKLRLHFQAAAASASEKNSFPTLHTERLVLNQLALTDASRVVQLAGNEKIARMTLNIPHPYHEKDAISWIEASHQHFAQATQYNFAIRKKESPELIGAIGLVINPKHQRGTAGYWMGEPYWNKGYTSEAFSSIIRYGFQELKLNKIDATHLLSNPASGKVMIKNGMILEGELAAHYRKGDVFRSVKQYRLLRKEWEKR